MFRFMLTKKLWVISAILASIFILFACDITNPTDGIRAILNLKERTTTVSVIILDAVTEEPVGLDHGSNPEVRITGADSDLIIDLFNRPTTTFEAVNGFLTFAILDEIEPSPGNPVSFDLEVTVEGYLPVVKPVRIFSGGEINLELVMTDINNMPDGVRGEFDIPIGEIGPDGKLINDVSFGNTEFEAPMSTFGNDPPPPPVSSITPGVRFTAQAGTEIRADNGTLLEGQLTATYVYHDGFAFNWTRFGETVINDQVDEAIFSRNGTVYSQIKDENGNTASFFDPPMNVSFVYRNVESGQEETGIWGNDQANRSFPYRWTYFDDTEVNPIEDPFGRDMSVSTLSFNEIPHWKKLGTSRPACQIGTEVNISGTKLRLYGSLFEEESGRWIQDTNSLRVEGGDQRFRLNMVPAGVPSSLHIYNLNNTLLETIYIEDLCTVSALNETIVTDEFDVTFIGVGTCAGTDDEIRPSFDAWIKWSESWRWRKAGRVSKGILDMTLPEPGTYTFKAYYEDRAYSYDFHFATAEDTVISEEQEIPENICDSL